MTPYEQAELASRIELAIRKLLDAVRKHEWEAFDRYIAQISELRTAANQATDTD